MRRSTLLWLVLATFCGAALFHTSQKVHDERQKISTLNDSIAGEEETMRVLGAEWSYLNQPVRLEKLNKDYLAMAPLTARQFIKVEDIPMRPADAPVTTVAAVPQPEAPVQKAAAAKPIKKPVIATAKPVVKIRKTESLALIQKPAPKKPKSTEDASTRSFSDVMKNLKQGIE